MTRLNFTLENTAPGSMARAGRFKTLHNEVLTPTFMPVGTHASVRSQRREDLLDAGAQVLLANTYHLLLRPGIEIFKQFGGIHPFMNWPRSVLTDSGGFQIFCLPDSRIMQEDGAIFKSYVNGETICLSPEKSIETQTLIGSDIMMALDQCVPSTVERTVAKQAMDLTHRWAKRSLKARGDSPQSLFGIVQGACYTDLRIESAKAITQLEFDGFAIGGLAVGESAAEREECTATVTALLPQDRPRYLMGVGTPLDLLEAVHRGVDMFDCILPTSMAQQGVAFTSIGRRDLRRGQYRTMEGPLDPACSCYTCKTYSLAYLFHIHRVHETQAWQLLALHNIQFYMRLTQTMRVHILAGTWLPFYAEQREKLDARDSYGPKSIFNAKAERTQRKMELGRYEVIVRDEVGRIRDRTSGEVMHSVSDPIEEARTLYVDQSRVVAKAHRNSASSEPLVIWDVGLGAAANAMATILALEESLNALTKEEREAFRVRKVVMVSFENDLDALRLALRHPGWFKHLRHRAPNALLKDGLWQSGCETLEWRLVADDFAKTKHLAPRPDIIYFDPFSLKTDQGLWTLDAFQELHELCASGATELFTYSTSTAVRSALLAAGFYVAKGAATGPKAETTIAMTRDARHADHPHELLGQDWLERWNRSDAKTPFGVKEDSAKELWLKRIIAHPQFQG